MPTNYKWYPGHYCIGAGDTKNLTTLLDGIAGTGTNNIKNLVGVQIRYVWKNLEIPDTRPGAAAGAYRYEFQPILNDLQTLKNYSASAGRHLSLRILLQFKGIGGRGAPEYLWKTTNAGYRPEYGIGVYTWGNAANPDNINEHPALWIPAVEERLVKFMEAMGAALDSIGRPAGDIRYHLSTVDFNETSWGRNGDTPLTSAQQTAQKDALLRLQLKTKAAFPTTIVGHFTNFPAFAFNNMVGPMRDNGITLGGPDTWWDDPSVENGVYQKYADAWGLTCIAPSFQNQNWEFKKHADVNPPVYYIGHLLDGDTPTLQRIFDRMTTAGTSVDGEFRAGLRGTHIAWQCATWQLHNADGSLSAHRPWNLVRNFFKKLWDEGPYAGNTTPGIDAATIPLRLQTGAPPPPPPPTGTLTLALTTDTGASATDKITSNAGVTPSGATAGATLQYSTSTSGPWTSAPPTPAQGTNTWYVRQVVSGSPSEPSAPLTFTFDTTVPVLSSATIDGTILYLVYDDAVNLSNTLRAPISAFQVKVGGVARSIGGNFVNEALKRVRLELGTAVTEGQTVTVSYTKPATGTAFTQDLAGNAAANLVDAPVTNLTGITAPTTTVTITAAGGVADGGWTNQATPTLAGTISAPLATGETLELQRSTAGGAFAAVGAPTVTGTDWSFGDATLAEGAHAWRARVRQGELLGTWSATFTANIDTTPPEAPSASSTTVAHNAAPRISGTWSNAAGDTLAVAVGALTYTTETGLVITGTSWVLDLPVQPYGRHSISARVTDRAGNVALDEDNAELVVLAQPSINHARLMKARRSR